MLRGMRAMGKKLAAMYAAMRKRYDAGMSSDEAVKDIDLGEYAAWGESERVVVNVNRLYAEFSGDDSEPNVIELFSTMADVALGIDD